jgi:hypothetical protein
MKTFLFLALLALIFCDDSFLKATKEEKLQRQQKVKAKILDCIYQSENASQDFKEKIKQNEAEFRKFMFDKRKEIRIEDKIVVRECRRKVREQMKAERKQNEL